MARQNMTFTTGSGYKKGYIRITGTGYYEVRLDGTKAPSHGSVVLAGPNVNFGSSENVAVYGVVGNSKVNAQVPLFCLDEDYIHVLYASNSSVYKAQVLALEI